eukprot:CAMPEP_0170577938 /NCGR_PEP_ID=MMETSP0224-20130122/5194_1 /TAXON_ID=285029 /ORGANISM="Togula jolla, Strain CCCM 725" /LENGTH=449 /DNA_ID=CAMNT_0010900883 /DNA_START=46 /DNA_END=1395 /DNA_ORIENTATION=+
MHNLPEQEPLFKKGQYRGGSVFHKDARLRFNALAVFINVFVPWGVAVFIMVVAGFWLMYSYPVVAWSLIGCCFLFWFGCIFKAFRARRNNPDPTWFSYLALMVGIACIFGTYAGWDVYHRYTLQYYQLKDMKIVGLPGISGSLGDPNGSGAGGAGLPGHGAAGYDSSSAGGVDPYTATGTSLMDAGMIAFTPGSQLTLHRSWHFKHKSLYCVAPVTNGGLEPASLSYDIWIVGKDCCTIGAADYRCGLWRKDLASTLGVRVMDDEDTKYFRLAVQQAASVFGIQAKQPIFFRQTHNQLDSLLDGLSDSSANSGASSSAGNPFGSSSSSGYGSSASRSAGSSSASSSSSSSASSSAGVANNFGRNGGGAGLLSSGMSKMLEHAYWTTVKYMLFAFIFFLFAVAVASIFYSYLGRARSRYATDYYDSPEWRQGVPQKLHQAHEDHHIHTYA